MFREAIKKEMSMQGVTVSALSADCGINLSSLSGFLHGERTLSLKHLDNVLGRLNLVMLPRENFVFGEPKTLEIARNIMKRGV